ncbi:hypothetical protein ACJZ2D_016778 [Fusarium nematophilum]
MSSALNAMHERSNVTYKTGRREYVPTAEGRRDGIRKKRKPARRRQAQPTDLAPGSSALEVQAWPLSQPVSIPSVASAAAPSSSETRLPRGFISPSVIMHYDASAEERENGRPRPQVSDMSVSILSLTGADVLPRPALVQALTDAYFQHVHPFYPIVDEADLQGPERSVMLQQAVCLAGSLMQHDPDMVLFCRSQYEKVKTLIYLNHERDNVAILKSLCLLTCYSMDPTDRVSLDGPWHWSGIAIRLAIQMGLHKNSTHYQHPNPGCLRRIFWQLVNTDRLAAACWGRPSAFLQLQGCDVPPLTEDDFPTPGKSANAFLQGVRLSKILETITEANLGQSGISADDATKLVQDLCDWLHCLPPELQLHSPDHVRNAFWRPSIELHIWYFLTIILSQLLDSLSFPWRITSSSFVAASCMARLYDEIHCREETAHLLQIHGFFCMVAAVPLICFRCGSRDMIAVRDQDLGIICAILGRMRHRYGGSDLVLTKIRRLQEEMKRVHGFTFGNQSSDTDDNSMPATSCIQTHFGELFPFPKSFCGALNYLDHSMSHITCPEECLPEPTGREFSPFPNDGFLNLADILSMDFPAFDFSSGNEGFGVNF